MIETKMPPNLHLIDEDFLAGVRSPDGRYVTEIHAESDRAHVELEIISEPHIDVVADHEETSGNALAFGAAKAFADRWDRLRAPFGETTPNLLIVRGRARLQPASHTDELEEGVARQVWEAALSRVSERASKVLEVPDASGPWAEETATSETATVFLVRSQIDDPRPELALAVIAVVGIPGSEEPSLKPIERLIEQLVGTVARNVPLHVIAVSGHTNVDTALVTRCQELRIGLVLAAPSRKDDVLTLSRTAMQRGQSATEVAVVPCPSFKSGTGIPGATHVSIDVVKGECAIAFRHDLGSDHSPEPVQVVRPLPSASRVSSSERRLYSRVLRLLREAQSEDAENPALLEFGEYVDRTWAAAGYAALCDDAGMVPLPETRHITYNLLLLLRERSGGYDILLSNHSPLRASPLSDWNTLLLPAFKDVRDLLEHLRDDVVRQVTERAEDYERAAHAEAFERAVNRILSDDGPSGDELWADQLREVGTRTIRKISPTTGAVTEFTYHLLTLLPLVDRSLAKPVEQSDGVDLEASHRNDRHRIIQWLKGLDTVGLSDEDPAAYRGIPIEAFYEGGAGLRWDPETMLGEEPNGAIRRRRTQAYPGAMWFPLSRRGEPSLWRRCPAIVARNADVMTWIEGELELRRRTDDSFPEQLVLGRYAGSSDEYRIERAYPFEPSSISPPGGNDPDDEDVPTGSTTEALALVRLNQDFDLADQLAYEGARFERVWLVRGPAPLGEDRDAIYVYPAEPDDREFDVSTTDRTPHGLLRPVQRYVLRAGLERVAALGAAVHDYLGEEGDPWGFLRVRKGGAPGRVSVTPPIIEQVHAEDWSDPALGIDFVVCDGNHRIVQAVWGQRGVRKTTALAAVAVIGKLRQPYYARPFGALEWEATADNELIVAPDVASKYLPRSVHDPVLLERYRGREKMLYRRYFRELESGFGPVGGQGGRFA
jgi:hypothetical protein